MSETHPSPAEITHAPASSAGVPPYFTYEEWQQFQKSDLGAGGVVVALMTSIFVIGLVLYSSIALILVS